MAACGQRVRFAATWQEEFFEVPVGRMKEVDFLERIVAISMIGKNVKQKLKECLDTRNACGHPSSFKVGPLAVASHIEILLLNVLQPYAK